MSDEERLKWLKEIEKDIYVCSLESTFVDDAKSCAIHSVIQELEQEQKTGHWIEKNVNQDGTHNIYCSNCNNYQKFKGHANSYNARTKLKYCPNCGAKMEGE